MILISASFLTGCQQQAESPSTAVADTPVEPSIPAQVAETEPSATPEPEPATEAEPEAASLEKVEIAPIKVTAGEMRQLQVTATDGNGESIDEFEIIWEMIDDDAGAVIDTGNFTAATRAGNYEDAIKVNITAGDVSLSAVASVIILPNVLGQVVIAPERAEIGIGMTQQFMAAAADLYGNRLSNIDFSWSTVNGSGSIDQAGLFSAGETPGDYDSTVEVKATQGNVVCSATADVIIEPDRIVFYSGKSQDNANLFIMDSDGGNLRQLSDTSLDGGQFSCSPDGRYILYDTGGFHGGDIILMSRDGESRQCIVEGDNILATFSPDGTRIAFLAYNERDETDIFVADIDGGNLTQLTDEQVVESRPAWSPDGAKIAYSDGEDVYIVESDGGTIANLTEESPYNARNPDWFPDGTKITYFRESGITEILFMMDPDGSDQELFINHAFSPVWSPDGSEIAYLSSSDNEIHLDIAEFTYERVITTNGNIAEYSPAWSPDGSRIAFVRDYDTRIYHGDLEVWVMDTNGSKKTCLTDNKNIDDTGPQWLPRRGGIEVSEDSIVLAALVR